MTNQEVSQRYNIPVWILEAYESWGFHENRNKVKGSWQYDDSDLERLSMMLTLHDAGFTGNEVEIYMRLLLKEDDTKVQRIQLLKRKRDHLLDEIHFKEAQLARLDYLRHNISNTNQKKS